MVQPLDRTEASITAAFNDITPLLESGNFMLDVGRGMRRGFGTHLFSYVLIAGHHGGDLHPLFNSSYAGAPRRLNLLFYTEVLGMYDPRRAGGLQPQGGLKRVSADGCKCSFECFIRSPTYLCTIFHNSGRLVGMFGLYLPNSTRTQIHLHRPLVLVFFCPVTVF
jgi:hypothetical protein